MKYMQHNVLHYRPGYFAAKFLQNGSIWNKLAKERIVICTQALSSFLDRLVMKLSDWQWFEDGLMNTFYRPLRTELIQKLIFQ